MTLKTKFRQQYVSKQFTTAVAIAIFVGMLSMFYLYTTNQKKEILDSNETAMSLVTKTIIFNLHAIMVAGYADIARDFADDLKTIPGISTVNITRLDGSEAFLDNKTIEKVNTETGEDSFYPRDTEDFVQIIDTNDQFFQKTLTTESMTKYYETINGEDFLTFIAPIKNVDRCHSCHGKNQSIRGFLKISTSLESVNQVLDDATRNSTLVFIVTSIIILMAMLQVIFERLIFPLNALTSAMKQISKGHLHLRAPVNGNDEIADIAKDFNVMIHRIEHSYIEQEQEQNKLMTIVQTNQEGVICADNSGNIILANPAATKILGYKDNELIGRPFDQCLNEPGTVNSWFENIDNILANHYVEYYGKTLNIAANIISDDSGNLIGRSLRFHDVTEELENRNRLQKLSTIDSLTGLFNRRHFDQSVNIEIDRTLAQKQPLSMLLIDIDFFKKVNDSHGHDIGDKVLVDMSLIIKNTVRTNDIPCRFGGEEFIVLLPETHIANGIQLAERLRKEIEHTPLGGINITVSIGVSSLNLTENNKAGELLKLSDTELYRAKHSGRNQVCFAETNS